MMLPCFQAPRAGYILVANNLQEQLSARFELEEWRIAPLDPHQPKFEPLLVLAKW
jgi:hypothetical protein